MTRRAPPSRNRPPKVYFYVEGDDSLGRGFRALLQKWCEKAGVRFRFEVVMGGNNSQTVEDWRTMHSLARETDTILLLIDSEGPVPESEHVVPSGCVSLLETADLESGNVFFMVQLMEAWFLTKPKELAAVYGEGFKTNKLPAIPTHGKPSASPGTNLEAVSKERIEKGLIQASKGTRKGCYDRAGVKTAIARRILVELDLSEIAEVSFHARRLADRLDSFCSN